MKGLTLIDLLIILCISSILGIIAFHGNKKESISKNTRPIYIEESHCVNGYKFYDHTQILNESGHGIPCN